MILGNAPLPLTVDVSNKMHHSCLFLFYCHSTEAAMDRHLDGSAGPGAGELLRES